MPLTALILRMRRRGRRLTFGLLAMLLPLLLLELLSRILLPMVPRQDELYAAALPVLPEGYSLPFPIGEDPWTKDMGELFEIDLRRGWRLHANVAISSTQAGRVVTNSLGLRDSEFPRVKPSGELRIACLGDSSTFGLGLNDARLLYPSVLEQLLRREYGERSAQVINAGVPGYTSFQARRMLQDVVLKCDPDLVTVYVGNNDSVGGFDTAQQISQGTLILKARLLLRHSSLYRLIRRLMLIGKPGGEMAPRLQLQDVPLDFENNIRAIIDECRSYDIDVALLTIPVNLRQEPEWFIPPFLSEEAEEFFERGKTAYDAGKYLEAEHLLQASLQLEDNHPETLRLLGSTYESLGRWEKAIRYYQLSIDVNPGGRASSQMNDALRSIAEQTDVPLVDIVRLFRSRDGIRGIFSDKLFADYIHPSVEGHLLIARALEQVVLELYGNRLKRSTGAPAQN